MVDYTPAPSDVKTYYPYLRDGTAFNRDHVEHAHLVRMHTLILSDILREHFDLADHADSMQDMANQGMAEYRDHIDDHLTNLPQKAAVALSWASDYIGFGLDQTSNNSG